MFYQRARGLNRFREAQAPIWDQVLTELRAGEKRTHWMWFIFPQGKGLGHSYRSKLYALSRREARQYAADPLLGERLRLATSYVHTHLLDPTRPRTLEQIFGEVDAMKFLSCMYLFYDVTGEAIFREALPDLGTGH